MTIKMAVITTEKSPSPETVESIYVEIVLALDKIRTAMFDGFVKLLENPEMSWAMATASILAAINSTLNELEYINTLSPRLFKALIQNANKLRGRLENFKNALAGQRYKPVEAFGAFISGVLLPFKEDVERTGRWPAFARVVGDEVRELGQHVAAFSK